MLELKYSVSFYRSKEVGVVDNLFLVQFINNLYN